MIVVVKGDVGGRVGFPLARAGTSVLFLNDVQGARGIELLRDGRVLETVTLK